jgi:pantothenate kinase
VSQASVDLRGLRDRAIALASTGRRAILGIAGPPGAGKSTLAHLLVAAADAVRPGWAVRVPMDGFHLADAQLVRLGLRDRKGAPETFDVAGYRTLLERLRADDDVVYAPGFERDVEQPIAASIAVPSACRLIVTEGNYLSLPTPAWRRVRALVDEVWYCELDDPTRVERLIARHIAFGKQPGDARDWVRRSDEPNARLVRGSRADADLIVDIAGLATPLRGAKLAAGDDSANRR